MDITENIPEQEEKDFRTGLEDAIIASRRALQQASKEEELARQQAAIAKEDANRAQFEFQRLQSQRDKALEQYAQTQQEESDLHVAITDESYQARLQDIAQQDALAQQVRLARENYEQGVADADAAAQAADRALEEFSQQRVKMSSLMTEQEQRRQMLQENFSQTSRQMSEIINEAGSRVSLASIQCTAADTSARLAQNSLDELAAALQKADEDILNAQNSQEKLRAEHALEVKKQQQVIQEAAAECKAAEDQAGEALKSAQEAMEMAQSLDALAQNAYMAAEKKAADFTVKIKELYNASEQEATSMAKQMEQALLKAVSEREAYISLLEVANQIEAQAQQATAEETELRERILRIRLEYQDLKNAALAASNLSQDATSAKIKADRTMQPALIEMEAALSASASEARQMATAKESELREAEAASATAFAYTAKKREAVKEARAMLAEAEENCNQAEQTVLRLSTLIQQRSGVNSENNAALLAARSAYDQSTKEALNLKEAADVTNNNLRIAKNDLEKVERSYLETIRATRNRMAELESLRAEMEEKHQALLRDTTAQLNIARQKRDKINSVQGQKLEAVNKCQKALAIESETLKVATSELERKRAEAEALVSSLQHELVETLSQDKMNMEDAQRLTSNLAKEYDRCLLASINAANQVLKLRETLITIEGEEKAGLEAIAAIRLQREQQAAERLEKAAIASKEKEREVAVLNNPVALATLEMKQARRRLGSCLAALDLWETRTKNHLEKLDRLEAENNDIIQAEEQRRLDALAAAELAARRAEEKRLREEDERRQKEAADAARLAAEQEAARERALAERARLEEERLLKIQAEEEEAVRLAAGEALLPTDDLTTLTAAIITKRLSMVKKLAAQEAEAANLRWITAEQAQNLMDEAKFNSKQAAHNKKLFIASQDATKSLHLRYQELKEERHRIGPVWAAKIALADHAHQERPTLEKAYAQTQQVLEQTGSASRALMQDALDNIQQALDNNSEQMVTASHELQALEQEVYSLDARLSEAKQAYTDALALLNQIAAKWVYFETLSIKANAKVTVVKKETADREQIRKEAEERINAARDAASASSKGYRRIGSASEKAPPAQRRKRPRP